jgi:hypothetical protein
MKANPNHVARCRCGAVEIGAWSNPLVVAACYCDDCQAASERLAAAGNSAPLAGVDGGTEFMVFRRDRIPCTRGVENLQLMRLTAATKTRRMVSGCCATPMYVGFDDKRPWVSAFRASSAPMRLRWKCGSAPGSDGPNTRLKTACPSTPAIRLR